MRSVILVFGTWKTLTLPWENGYFSVKSESYLVKEYVVFKSKKKKNKKKKIGELRYFKYTFMEIKIKLVWLFLIFTFKELSCLICKNR